MKNFSMFTLNLLLAIVFSWDAMDCYFMDGLNIISNDVNRVFIIWLGLITTYSSSVYFVGKSLENLQKRK